MEARQPSGSKPVLTTRLIKTLDEEGLPGTLDQEQEVVNNKEMPNAQANNPDMSSFNKCHDDDALYSIEDLNQLASRALIPATSIFETLVEAMGALAFVPKTRTRRSCFVVPLAVAM